MGLISFGLGVNGNSAAEVIQRSPRDKIPASDPDRRNLPSAYGFARAGSADAEGSCGFLDRERQPSSARRRRCGSRSAADRIPAPGF